MTVRYLYRVSLTVSVIGFIASLVVHVRSLLGFGLHDWFLHFIFILLLMGPWFLAVDDVTRNGMTQWQSRPLDSAEAHLEKQILQGQLLFRTRPRRIKIVDYAILGYFILGFSYFLMKTSPTDPYSQSSGAYLPVPVTVFFSIGWMVFYWNFFGTFWRTLKLK
jgi:hypothetical protein